MGGHVIADERSHQRRKWWGRTDEEDNLEGGPDDFHIPLK